MVGTIASCITIIKIAMSGTYVIHPYYGVTDCISQLLRSIHGVNMKVQIFYYQGCGWGIRLVPISELTMKADQSINQMQCRILPDHREMRLFQPH